MATLPIARIACTGGTRPPLRHRLVYRPPLLDELLGPITAARALDSAAAPGGPAVDGPFARTRRVSRMSALEASWARRLFSLSRRLSSSLRASSSSSSTSPSPMTFVLQLGQVRSLWSQLSRHST